MASISTFARFAFASSASALALLATPALAQTAASDDQGIEEIIVTAQRQAESLQDVPIAVSAFSAEALERQQIDNSSDLQLTLPNITFTKGNFTGSSFTIRGVGDLCVGGTCDSATAIHANGLPLFGTRLFETEFFDLERVEVLRGPQGTLFGRNATSGVVNFITARPSMTDFSASGEAEYGNYNSIKAKGMVNVPISDAIGVRLAGFYLDRDGFTKNLFDNSNIDDRNMYAVRGSLRLKPGENTTIDLMGYYFKEDDSRLRIQKQQCQRDATGVLGCLPGRRDYGITNANSTFVGVLSSREFLRIATGALGPVLTNLGLGSLYGTDPYATATNPADPRTVNTDYNPTYVTDEAQFQAVLDHDFESFQVKLSGQYQRNKVDSSQDYNLSVQNPAGFLAGLTAFNAFANGAGPAPLTAALSQLKPAQTALLPNGVGATTSYCTSLPEETGTGAFGGNKLCGATPLDFDRSRANSHAWTGELIIESKLDGRFNFLLGGIYNDIKSENVDYYVNSFGIDYISSVLGLANTLGRQLAGATTFPNSFGASPFFRSNQASFGLKSYGLFGEAYFDLSDSLKLTGGIRYNNDKKDVSARTTLISDVNSATVLVPYGAANITQAAGYGTTVDFDSGRTGAQTYANRSANFSEMTGRVVLDWKISDDNLVYASYSRGYKSGGHQPAALAGVRGLGDVPA